MCLRPLYKTHLVLQSLFPGYFPFQPRSLPEDTKGSRAAQTRVKVTEDLLSSSPGSLATSRYRNGAHQDPPLAPGLRFPLQPWRWSLAPAPFLGSPVYRCMWLPGAGDW